MKYEYFISYWTKTDGKIFQGNVVIDLDKKFENLEDFRKVEKKIKKAIETNYVSIINFILLKEAK